MKMVWGKSIKSDQTKKYVGALMPVPYPVFVSYP